MKASTFYDLAPGDSALAMPPAVCFAGVGRLVWLGYLRIEVWRYRERRETKGAERRDGGQWELEPYPFTQAKWNYGDEGTGVGEFF